jgi:hypothetical protein
VNVIGVPGQTLFWEAVIETSGIGIGITVTGMLLLVTVAGLGQTALEVISTVTLLPLVKLVVVNVGLLVPALTPFTFH